MSWARGLRYAPRSIRSRITAVATLAAIVVLSAAGIALVVAQQRLLTENLSESLLEHADAIASSVEREGVPEVLGEFGDDDAFAQLVAPSGEVVAATANVAGAPPLVTAPADGRGQIVRSLGSIAVDDAPYRVVVRHLDHEDVEWLVIGASLDDIHESIGVLALSLAVTVPVVAAALSVLTWWLVGRTLRPVEAIRAEVAAIGGDRAARRVPVPPSDDEIADLARTMNAMLDRVDEAAQRQRRFVADASHELRSPLTRIRSELEVDLARPDQADLEATHRSVLDEAIALQRLVEDLLHLARSDAGALEPPRAAVDLDDIVLQRATAVRADGRVMVDTRDVAPAQVLGDRDQLARVVGNLVDNAVRHAASAVSFTLSERDGVATLVVADDGPGVAAQDHERVFERFTRVDDARASATGGAGLGLAIARDIVERHGGTLTIEDPGRGARFVARIPLADPTPWDPTVGA